MCIWSWPDGYDGASDGDGDVDGDGDGDGDEDDDGTKST